MSPVSIQSQVQGGDLESPSLARGCKMSKLGSGSNCTFSGKYSESLLSSPCHITDPTKIVHQYQYIDFVDNLFLFLDC